MYQSLHPHSHSDVVGVINPLLPMRKRGLEVTQQLQVESGLRARGQVTALPHTAVNPATGGLQGDTLGREGSWDCRPGARTYL